MRWERSKSAGTYTMSCNSGPGVTMSRAVSRSVVKGVDARTSQPDRGDTMSSGPVLAGVSMANSPRMATWREVLLDGIAPSFTPVGSSPSSSRLLREFAVDNEILETGTWPSSLLLLQAAASLCWLFVTLVNTGVLGLGSAFPGLRRSQCVELAVVERGFRDGSLSSPDDD